jgi:hypothetical protein
MDRSLPPWSIGAAIVSTLRCSDAHMKFASSRRAGGCTSLRDPSPGAREDDSGVNGRLRPKIACAEKLILRGFSIRSSLSGRLARIFLFLFFGNMQFSRASRLVERGVARDRHDT